MPKQKIGSQENLDQDWLRRKKAAVFVREDRKDAMKGAKTRLFLAGGLIVLVFELMLYYPEYARYIPDVLKLVIFLIFYSWVVFETGIYTFMWYKENWDIKAIRARDAQRRRK